HYSCEQRRRSNAPDLSAVKRCVINVAVCFHLSIGLVNNPAAKLIFDQGLMSLSQSQLPVKTCMLYRAYRRSTRAPIVTCYQNNIGLRLSHTCCNSSNSGLRHELYVNPGLPVGVFQIKY